MSKTNHKLPLSMERPTDLLNRQSLLNAPRLQPPHGNPSVDMALILASSSARNRLVCRIRALATDSTDNGFILRELVDLALAKQSPVDPSMLPALANVAAFRVWLALHVEGGCWPYSAGDLDSLVAALPPQPRREDLLEAMESYFPRSLR